MKRFVFLFCLVAVSLACLVPSGSLVADTSIPVTGTPTPTVTPVNTFTVVSSGRPCARVTATSLHVRYGADYDSAIMGWVTHDTLVTVRRQDGDWWVIHGHGIDFQGRETRMTGFVKSDFLELCPCYVQSQFNTQRR